MPNQGQRASLRDVLNYEPEQYLSDAELSLIRNTFKKNPALIKVLRKVMIPTITDPELPLEQLGNDMLLQGREWAAVPADEAKILMVARQDAFQFISGGLIKLQVIANQVEETETQATERTKKNSNK